MKTNGGRVSAGLLGVALCFAVRVFAEGAPLRSPWDGKPIAMTAAPYSCPALPAISPDLTTDGFYRTDDPTHSLIDPARQAAYAASSGPVKQVGLAIVAAADAYRTTGARAAAVCATQEIATLARAGALTGKMSSNQAYYVQGWVAGAIAIAYLKLESRRKGITTPGARARMGMRRTITCIGRVWSWRRSQLWRISELISPGQ